MSQLMYYDTTAGQWLPVVVGAQGITGAQGIQGTTGITGDTFIVNYLDGGGATPNTDIIYNAGTATTTSWTYTIDASGATVSF